MCYERKITGRIMTSDNNIIGEINGRIQKANVAWEVVKNRILIQPNIHVKLRIAPPHSPILTILLYGRHIIPLLIAK